jgi:hypothetical protein
MREAGMTVEKIDAYTKDNVPVQLSAVLFYQVKNAIKLVSMLLITVQAFVLLEHHHFVLLLDNLNMIKLLVIEIN